MSVVAQIRGRITFLVLAPFLLGLGASAPASSTPSPASPALPAAPDASDRVRVLQSELRDALPLDRWRGARWAILVTSLEQGDTVFALDAHRTMTPASNVKLLTVAAALHHLGPDYRYETLLLSDGSVVDGVLQGDLVIYGTGDPSLANRFRPGGIDPMRELARELRRRGVTAVRGDVVGDGTYFTGPERPSGWGRANLNDWFAAPPSSLSYESNVATLRIGPGAGPGSPLRVETIPAEAPVVFDMTGRTVSGRPGHPVWALREDPSDPVRIVGEMTPGERSIWRRITISNPPLYAAERLRSVLEQEGVRVEGGARAVTDRASSLLDGRRLWAPSLQQDTPRPRVLVRVESPPLSELLTEVNKASNNLFAEAIVRTLGRVVGGEGSFEVGTRIVQRYLVDEAGVPPAEARPVDGSGLSPENRVSPYAFVRVLEHMARSRHWDTFRATLPEAGNWRELRRMYRSPAAGNLRAKTGTIESVSALSGTVRGGNGETFLFSILSNGVPSTSAAKRVEDEIGILLASFSRSVPEPTAQE